MEHNEEKNSCEHNHHEHFHEENHCGCGHHHHEHNHEHNHEHHHNHNHSDCNCHEAAHSMHNHTDDKDLLHYKKDLSDVMKTKEEIDLEERRSLGHIHHELAADTCDVCGNNLSVCHCQFLDEGYFHIHCPLARLNCRDCAAKLEGKIREMPAVHFASVSFLSKELRLITKEDPKVLLPTLSLVAKSVNPEIQILENVTPETYRTETYSIPTLDCPVCAGKLERVINEAPNVFSATVSFATKQLHLTAKNPDALIPDLIQACNAVEPGTIIEKVSGKKKTKQEKQSASPLKTFLYAVAFLLFVIGLISEYAEGIVPIFFSHQEELILGVSYLIFGGEILWKAGKNILHGEIFDENFLMSVATLGAVAIQEMPEAVGIMLFYRIGEYLEDCASEQSRDQISAAVDLRPDTVQKISDEGVETIPAENAAIGDILLIRPGDRIPLDGIVTEGHSQIDTSPVTGEPKPVLVSVGDALISGCINQEGTLRLCVEKVLSESMVTRILDSVENAVAGKPQMDRLITRFSRVYTPVVVLFAILVAVVPPLLLGAKWDYWIYTALTFLVISCPCALVISIPLSFFAGIGAASKQGILFKSGTAIETTSATKAVVMDKTGTLTEGKFAVRAIFPVRDATEEEILALAAAAETYSTHPIGRSVVTAAEEKNLSIPSVSDVRETAGRGIICRINDAVISLGNKRLIEEVGIKIPASDESFAGTEIWLAKDQTLLGSIRISDELKADAKAAVSLLQTAGITPIMLTGDATGNAKEIGEKLGMTEIYANLLPEEKLENMRKIREEKGSVLYVGDGINDAPVLAGADTGAAMGSGADAAMEAADIVFLRSKVMSIPQSILIAKSVISVAWQNITFALGIKIIVMLLGLLGCANMWLAVFADVGVTLLCILNAMKLLRKEF